MKNVLVQSCCVLRLSIILLLLLLWDTSTAAVLSTAEEQSSVGQFHVRRNAAAAAATTTATLEEACQPHHIHLSVGRLQNRTHSSMTVSFSISSACVGIHRRRNKSFGAVRLMIGSNSNGRGREREENNLLVIGDDSNSTKEYNAMSPSKGVGGRYYSDLYYHIEINDLRPDMEYSYECLLLKKRARNNNVDDDRIIARSDISIFTTPPAPGQWHSGAGRNTVKFAVIGDLAAKESSKETILHLDRHSQSVDAVLLAGDLAYPNKNHVLWDKWMDFMCQYDFFRAIPVQIALGNHDLDTFKPGWVYDKNETVEIAVAYENRFQMPQSRPPIRDLASMQGFTVDGQPRDFIPYDFGNAYYSYTFGPSKHIVLSSFSNFREGSLQYEWLLSELKSVDRSITPWLIVMPHCPLYTTFHTHSREIFTTEARAILEPLFVEYTVNFVISGHVHAYMRTHPVAFSRCNPRGPIHIIQGNGGVGRRASCEPYLNEIAEEWVAGDQSQYGYGTLELFNNTHAMWRLIKTGQDENNVEYESNLNLSDEIWVSNQLYADEMSVSKDWEDNS